MAYGSSKGSLDPAIFERAKSGLSARASLPVGCPRATLVVEALATRLPMLCDAYLSVSELPRVRALERMRRDGIGVDAIIDVVIPEIARLLGQRWAEDTLSFVDVSIGSSRLQNTVHALSRRETALTTQSLDTLGAGIEATPRVLMIIPTPEEHTLGTFVAADQLRRLGYDVDIAMDYRAGDLAAQLENRQYCMVGITISGHRALAATKELVAITRASVTQAAPLVLGGTLALFDDDLKRATGVDHVAHSVKHALEMCGLDVVEADPPQISTLDHAR